MRVPIFQVDAFTTRRFAGNPAAVLILADFPGDDVLQAVAAENNLAETAFLVPDDVEYRLRWFTPTVEVPLCGHATLASAAVVLERLRPDRDRVVFHTASGPLTVDRAGPAYRMDLPVRTTRPAPTPPGLAAMLGADPVEVVEDGHNYLARLADAATVRSLAPDLAAIARLDRSGVVVTAAGDAGYDIVSRYFAPAKGIPEDPVTGGAHCALTPYWAQRLGKERLRAFQASRRGGELDCRLAGDRVHLTGSCVFYLEGEAVLAGERA
jgi:PhzF family phenazine biosynthesis protein